MSDIKMCSINLCKVLWENGYERVYGNRSTNWS